MTREPESLERQFVRWVYASGEYEHLPYVPASREPKGKRRDPLPPISRVLHALTNAGCEWRTSTTDVDSWQSECPTHEDTKPSLHVKRNPDGMIWLKCWAGCSKEGILQALGLEWRDLWDASEHDHGRERHTRPLLPVHLRWAMRDLLRRDDERRAS